MPSLTTTIEENSPLITYLSDWTTGDSSTDNAASSYSESSFMATQTSGASASFTFNGTGVQIFGAKRGNHGPYSVKVDGATYPTTTGLLRDPGLFQQSLFAVDGLALGLHEVTITNQGTTFLDVDFITWTTNVGKPSEKLFVNTVQDTDSAFAYSSGAAWTTNPKNVGSFMGGSGQSQVLLYHANNLPPGEHRVKLTCQPTTSGQNFALDYATVYTTTPPQSVSEGGLPVGSIVGIILSIVGIFAVLAGLYFFLRRRQRQVQYHEEISHSYAEEKPLDVAQPRIVTISSFDPGPTPSDINTAQNFIPTPFISLPGSPSLSRPSPAKNATSGAKQQVRFSEQRDPVPSRTPSPGLAPPGLQPNRRAPSPTPSLNSIQPRVGLPAAPGPPVPQKKGQLRQLQPTDVERFDPENMVSPTRRVVEGRFAGATPQYDLRYSLVSVPPDYQWATHTQPYSGS
ncbi:hypothetical protein DXG01_016708 [Tephrocybe rancida]|nr:hypothetical protein DXG01_016708 [Tephrocybe rancida]